MHSFFIIKENNRFLSKESKEQKDLNYNLIFLFLFIELIFYFSINFSFVSYFGFILILLAAFFLKIENALYLLVFLLPNQRIIVFSSLDVTLINMILLIVFLKIFLLNKEKINFFTITLFTLWIVYSSISAYMGNITNIAIAIKAFLTILTFLYIFKRSISNKLLYNNLVMYFAMGCLTASIFGLIFSNDYILGSSIRFDPGGDNNPNIFGTMLSFAIVNLFLLTMLNKKFSWWLSLLIISLMAFGFMTQSRSFILAISFIFIYFSIFSIFNTKLNRRFLLYMILFMSTLISVIFITNSELLLSISNSSIERLINPKNEDISGGRLDIWTDYINLLFSDPKFLLFGIGDYRDYGFVTVPHNAFIDLITSWGILGSSIIIAVFSYIFHFLYQNLRKSDYHFIGMVTFAPFLVLIITSLTGHSILGVGVIMQFFICVLALFIHKDMVVASRKIKRREKHENNVDYKFENPSK